LLGSSPEIYDLCPPSPRDAAYQEFEKNWNGNYQKVKNVQLSADDRQRMLIDNQLIAIAYSVELKNAHIKKGS
jgi:hypothetical protein